MNEPRVSNISDKAVNQKFPPELKNSSQKSKNKNPTMQATNNHLKFFPTTIQRINLIIKSNSQHAFRSPLMPRFIADPSNVWLITLKIQRFSVQT